MLGAKQRRTAFLCLNIRSVCNTRTIFRRGKLSGLDKPTEGDDELVLVKELSGSRMRRSAESTLPRYLHMKFSVGGETMTLQLVRNTDIDTNIPFTFAGNKEKKVYIPDREVRSRQHAYEYHCNFHIIFLRYNGSVM